jgi:3-hydroxybutyryl-CoA dehydratase
MGEAGAPATVGETIGPRTVEVTAARVRAYAAASGDFNPIHVDPAFAATTDFGTPIAHGMLLLAYLARVLGARFGRAWAATGTLDARFRAPALVGATITVRGEVHAATSEAGGMQHVECRLSCEDAQGQTLVTATAVVSMRAGGADDA